MEISHRGRISVFCSMVLSYPQLQQKSYLIFKTCCAYYDILACHLKHINLGRLVTSLDLSASLDLQKLLHSLHSGNEIKIYLIMSKIGITFTFHFGNLIIMLHN